MPLLAYPTPAFYVPNSELTLLDRFLRISGDPAQTMDFVSMALSVKDMKTGSETLTDEALTIADVMYDRLLTDTLWKKDRIGYNFRYHAAGTAFPLGNRKYKAELLVTPTVGDPFNRHWVLSEFAPIRVRIIEDSHAIIMARVYLRDGSLAQVADISAISLTVTNKETGSVTDGPTALTVGEVMRNGTVVDGAWDIDETGWNLQHFAPDTAFPDPAKYDVQLDVTPAVGGEYDLRYEAVVEPLVTS